MKVKLKDIFDLQMGKTPSRNNPSYWGGENKWVSIADIGKVSKYIGETKENITDAGVSESGIKKVPQNTVIMSFKLSIGKTAITTENMYTNEAIMAFIDKKVYPLDTNYFYHLCSGRDWSAGTNKAVMGLTLNKATLSEIEIELPPIDKQKSVAFKLDFVDSLITARREQLAKLDELVKSRFVELFGDIVNCPKYSGIPLGSICSTLSGGTPTTKVPEYYRGDIPWISTPYLGNNHIDGSSAKAYITEDAIKNSATHLIPANTIMFGIRVGVGKSSIIDEPMCANQDIVALMNIDTKMYDLLFIKYVLDAYQNHFDSIKKGATILGITTDDLKKVVIPSVDMKLQRQFATFVEQVDKSKFVVKESLEKLETLKKALMQKYFG